MGVKKIFAVIMILMVSVILYGRDLKKILRAIDKGDLPKTLILIEESLEKEPVNPGARYILAGLLSYDSLPLYNIDSARVVIDQAMEDHGNASEEELEDLEKNDVDLAQMQALASKIETQHYSRALRIHSTTAFQSFLNTYPESDMGSKAIRLRDSVAWEATRPQLSIAAYQSYLATYKEAHLSDEVTFRLDSLQYFRTITPDRLTDYQSFLDQFPSSPYVARAEKIVFERMTATNDAEDLELFIASYPRAALLKKAYDILYHLKGNIDLSGHPARDSAIAIQNTPNSLLVPIFKDGLFHFMDDEANLIPNAIYLKIPDEYVCGQIASDFLYGVGEYAKIVNRQGITIYKGDIRAVNDIGRGVLLVSTAEGKMLIHKSGFVIKASGIDGAMIVGDRWIKINVGDRYGLISFAGYEVTPVRYDDIELIGEFWAFERDGNIAIYTTEKIIEELHDDVLELEFKFDDFEIIQDSFLIGFRGARESLLDKSLRFLIPWGEHEISPGVPYHYARRPEGFKLYWGEVAAGISDQIDALQENDHWFGVKSDTSWTLINKSMGAVWKNNIDSLNLVGSASAIVVAGDSMWLQFPEVAVTISSNQTVTSTLPVPQKNIPPFIKVRAGKAVTLWTEVGDSLFTGQYSEVTVLKDTLFTVSKRGKSGVVSRDGREFVPVRYDAIQESEGLISLLQNGKIGVYDLLTDQMISSKYESKLERFGQYYVTVSDKKHGIIDHEENKIVDFEYDEIRYWNDSTAWLNNGNNWHLMNIETNDSLVTNVTSFNQVIDAHDKYVVFYSEDGYGLISSNHGLLVEPKFNDIKNLGTVDEPLFFVESFNKEAEFYVVVYFDGAGKRINSFAYRTEEYEHIYCDD